MAEYWKSTKKHHCAICNIWLPAHPRSIAVHNASEIHNSRKDYALQRLEREAADKAAEERNLSANLQAIEAAAIQSMKRRIDGLAPPSVMPPHLTSELTYKEAMSRVLPPALSHIEKQKEMQRLEAFIGDRILSAKNDPEPKINSSANLPSNNQPSLIIAPIIASYYGEFNEIPEIIRNDPNFNLKENWKEQIHESTGVPIWFCPMRNLYVWSEPPFFALDVKEKPEVELKVESTSEIRNTRRDTFEFEAVKTEQPEPPPPDDEGPDLRAVISAALSKAKYGDEEGVPGRWEMVEVGQEMTNRDALHVKPLEVVEAESMDALIKDAATADPLPGRNAPDVVDKYSSVDLERVARAEYSKKRDASYKTKASTGFKKRRQCTPDG